MTPRIPSRKLDRAPQNVTSDGPNMPEIVASARKKTGPRAQKGELRVGTNLARVRFATTHHRHNRGFTLVELLAVVAMIGVLSALAVVGFKKYMNSSRTADGRAIIAGIRVAQESFRAETLTYKSCSATLSDYYPASAPNGRKRHWVQSSHSRFDDWMSLNVVTDSPTAYVFAVVAGAAGDKPPNTHTSYVPSWPNPTTEPWYVIEAAGDADDDGTFCYLISSSFNGEIYVENDTE
jgi:type IV pilus assembly protein PilA